MLKFTQPKKPPSKIRFKFNITSKRKIPSKTVLSVLQKKMTLVNMSNILNMNSTRSGKLKRGSNKNSKSHLVPPQPPFPLPPLPVPSHLKIVLKQ